MSSRNSGYGEDSLPSSRCGVRTPLRSLENDIGQLSTPSLILKSKSQFSSDAVKMKMTGSPSCDQGPHIYSAPNKLTQTSPSPLYTNQEACGIGDITFKSFICAGGEVEIPGSLACAEGSIILHKDTATCNSATEETLISDYVTEQAGSDHLEHPYYDPNVKQPSLCEIANTTLSFCNVDDKQPKQNLSTFDNDYCGEEPVTGKSFLCDGGDIEVSDATRLKDETIPLPMAELTNPLQDICTNLISFSIDDLSQVESADHPYCINENGINPVTTSFSETRDVSEKPAKGLTDLTFKSFNCTGGEIEISEDTKCADETVSLPVNHTVFSSECNHSIDPSILAEDLQSGNDHFDHPYYNNEDNPSLPCWSVSSAPEAVTCSTEAVGVKQGDLMVPDCQESTEEHVKICSFMTAGGELEKLDDTRVSEKASFQLKDQDVTCQPLDKSVPTLDLNQDDNDQHQNNSNNAELVDNHQLISESSLTKTYSKALECETVDGQVQKTLLNTMFPEDCVLPSVAHTGSCLADSSSREVQQDMVSQVYSPGERPESSEVNDSALGSSSNIPAVCNSAEKPPVENPPDVLKVLSALDLKIFSPIVRRASQAFSKAYRDLAQDNYLADDSALEGEKSLVAPAGLWAANLESPMPRPLFNSTALGCKPQPDTVAEQEEVSGKKNCAVSQSEVEKPLRDMPLIPEGQLQQQLRQMAEFLILASGKMGPGFLPASAATVGLPQRPIPAESCSVCVGTSPVKLVNHSLNTSGVFERKREFSTVDSCTVTDPLLWNLPAGSLEGLPREELEQRFLSSMIMVEALVQQLAAARTQACLSAGPAPSDLREKLVQTDHTELSQSSMYRHLYMEALSRIDVLELDESSLQDLKQRMEDMRILMGSLTSDTDAALCNMKELGEIVKEDHEELVSHYEHTKSLFEKSKETQMRMMQKVKDALHQRNVMKTQMEEAFTAKEAAFSAAEQLRSHCATNISALEESVGSQQELLAALTQTHPEQVALNKECTETLNLASDVLSQTMDEHSSLANELCTIRILVQKAAPILLKLNEKAAAALRDRDEHISARDQAIEEREQIEEELNEANFNLQDARQQISDLNLQVTILTSEMGVLRQKLTEKEEETGQLERKVTELSATVSSSLASYTFLEQALSAETTKSQQSWKDAKQANEKANLLEASLGQSEHQGRALSRALAHSNEQRSQLQTLSQSQSLQIQQLQDVCAQLSSVKEMNEFLQMENDLVREQLSESERMLRTNLQALRERNIECEDLKGEVCKLEMENNNLREELESRRSTSEATLLGLEEKMSLSVTEITLLHYTLRGLTDELQAALNDQTQDAQKDQEPEQINSVDCHPPSFADSMTLTADKEEDFKPHTPAGSVPADIPEPQSKPFSSKTSAFTRIAAIVPKQNLDAADSEEVEEQSGVAELLSGLGCTVKELARMLKLVQRRKDAQLQELQNTICSLQMEQQDASNRHQSEVSELQRQLSRHNNLLERGNQALQQKAEDEKTLSKLMSEVQEFHDIVKMYKTDGNEMRKEVTELRRALQRAQNESRLLQEELRKAGGQSANPAHHMEEKIQLLKEVERLRTSLHEVEQARGKLLERAKRHQMIYETNHQKSENELQILNSMINRVRETLLSLPDIVRNCDQLKHLAEFIG
ncbi:sperm-associated antigen 5 [Cololabis saira]|uniref:sperm-associated antigen 5 n=1 Tax=Cololabis saira TaxID=129043 RepID=UPI002AD417C3|nr:sperm-associated antigen 5 [Cololabis saira]